MQRPRRLKRFAFGLTEILAVAAIIAAVPSSSYQRATQKTQETACANNLRQIAQLLQMYTLENDAYPEAAFFPADPAVGADSIKTILGGPTEIWTCPSLPGALQEKGMTFVYNESIGGKRALRNPDKKWVLIEMSCVSKDAPHPHPGGYNILFADGHIISSKRLPNKITGSYQ